MKRLLLTAAILSVAYCFEAGDYLTSEEDILDALSREEISFTEYYDLLELFRDKVELTGDDLDRLRAIPGVDRRWIEAIEEARENAGLFADRETFERWFPFDFERIRAFVFFEKRERRDMNGSVKLYTHGKFIEDGDADEQSNRRFRHEDNSYRGTRYRRPALTAPSKAILECEGSPLGA